jgi:hypothetical protein
MWCCLVNSGNVMFDQGYVASKQWPAVSLCSKSWLIMPFMHVCCMARQYHVYSLLQHTFLQSYSLLSTVLQFAVPARSSAAF